MGTHIHTHDTHLCRLRTRVSDDSDMDGVSRSSESECDAIEKSDADILRVYITPSPFLSFLSYILLLLLPTTAATTTPCVQPCRTTTQSSLNTVGLSLCPFPVSRP